MAYKPKFGTRRRESLYQREQLAAHKAGLGKFPICVHCNLPVTPDQSWDEAHIDVPKCLGGKSVGVGHRLCNRLDNNEVVTPMAAKVRRKRLRHLGVTGPGLGKHPLPAGRRSKVSKTINNGVQPRLTLGERLAALKARRSFGVVETDGVR
jgi:hypothetical protein